ncbi:RING/U-box [Apiospora aurea]|uniref:RING/U-box n=1 Tax=Apiospora aurea TaxID=335848 RepID=A0ABR1QHT3_9PEZI
MPVMYVPPPANLPPPLLQPYIQWQEPNRQQTRITSHEAKFHEIAPYLDTGLDPVTGQPVLIDLECDVCGHHLDVPRRVSPNDYPDAPLEPLCVLPCGHMMGTHCLDHWIRRADEAWQAPTCPLCRFQAAPRQVQVPDAVSPLLPREQQVPLTIPEGGRVDAYCGPCRDRRAETKLREWMDEHLPANAVHGSITRVQETRLQACIGGLARSARTWHRENSPRWTAANTVDY